MSHLPLPDAYQRALLNPPLCFSDAELKGGTVHLNRQSLPMTWSGQFATVFRVQTVGGPRAVRCFTSRISDHQERYARLHRHTSGKALPMLAAFDYQPNGLRVNGAWYPIVKMEWVNGLKLDDYVEELALQQDTRRLNNLAGQWRRLVACIRQNQIAHGDLQHENILVRQGEMRLVDYDGVFVPGLAGKLALELGHVHYQHPHRTPADFNSDIDNFSALVIYLSLRALAVEPGLWKKFHQDKHLLLRSDDFKSPQTSAALTALRQNRDADVRALASALTAACSASLAAVPTLEALLSPSATVPTAAPISAPPKPGRSAATRLWYLRNGQAWIVLGMGAITALLVNEIWIVALGVIGYLLVLLLENASRNPSSELQAHNTALEAQNRQLAQDVRSLQAEISKLQKKP